MTSNDEAVRRYRVIAVSHDQCVNAHGVEAIEDRAGALVYYGDHDAMVAKLRAELAAVKEERDAAVAESARRDQKWMDGIESVCGCKIDFMPPMRAVGRGPQPPSLDEFIRGLRSERDALAGLLAEARLGVAAIAAHHYAVTRGDDRAEQQGERWNGLRKRIDAALGREGEE